MDERKEGWMEAKARLRIAYSNQKEHPGTGANIKKRFNTYLDLVLAC